MSQLRQKGQPSKKQSPPTSSPRTDGVVDGLKETAVSEWDYKAALSVITVLGFITRFWGIQHPNEVVFDEVHFGKVGILNVRPESFFVLNVEAIQWVCSTC